MSRPPTVAATLPPHCRLPTADRRPRLKRCPAGSSTGIGYGILKQLAAAGATTVMHGWVPPADAA